jgi:hypothetical protein
MPDLADLKLLNVPFLPNRVSYEATLGPFRFSRGHSYYWITKGPMPLEIAKEIYKDRDGRHSVRAGGHGCAVPPEEQATWVKGGKEVMSRFFRGENQEEKYRDFIVKGILPENPRVMFSDDPALEPGAVGYVLNYHIDNLLGLKLYVDTIRNHGLDKLPTPEWLDWL